MKRAIYGVLALVLLAGSSGCCCFEKLFCCGCGPCAYGHGGPSYGGCDSCGGGGCGGGGCSDCGLAGGSVTSPSYEDMAQGGPGPYGPGGPGAYGPGGPGPYGPGAAAGGKYHPAQGHPMVHQRRNAGGQYQFAAGPPTAGVSYPYYTNRGPRDFLARNPRSIGP